MSVRPAENRDIETILRLLVQVDMVHHAIRPDLFKGPATKYTKAELSGILKDPDAPVFVFEDAGGRVAGYAMCRVQQHVNDNILTDIRTLYLDDLCVDEEKRGTGVGREIFAYVRDYAAKNGFYNLTLNVWAGNDSAKRFYEACGLKPQKYGMELILDEREQTK